MQYIKTKYLGPTNFRGSRVKAPAWVEYKRVKTSAWAEYERVKAAAFGRLASC